MTVRLVAQRFCGEDKMQTGRKMGRPASMSPLLSSAGLDCTMGGRRVWASPGGLGWDEDTAKGAGA